MNKKLYTIFSFSSFIWSLILRLACVLGIIYFTTIYNENPPVILFLIIVSSIFIFVTGYDQIDIYSNKIIISDNSFSSLFIKPKGQIYLVDDIKLAYTTEEPKSSKTEIGIAIAMLMIFLLPKRRSQFNNTSTIFLDLKNGETKKIDTSLGQSKICDVVKDINLLAKSNGRF